MAVRLVLDCLQVVMEWSAVGRPSNCAACLEDQGIPLRQYKPTLPQCMTPSQRQSLCVLRLPVPERPPALLHLPRSLPAMHQPYAVDTHACQRDEHNKIWRSSLPIKV